MNVSCFKEMLVACIKLKENIFQLDLGVFKLFPEFLFHVSALTVFSDDVAVIDSFIGINILEQIFMIYGSNALELKPEESS